MDVSFTFSGFSWAEEGRRPGDLVRREGRSEWDWDWEFPWSCEDVPVPWALELACNEMEDVLAAPSTRINAEADPLAFLEVYPDVEAARESDTIEDEDDGKRWVCPNSRGLSGGSRSSSWDSSEDSEMMGGRVEKPGPARGEERHGRVCISPL